MSTVFISGSISIKKLPKPVEKSLQNIIEQGMEILVGDADGVDTLVQRYCESQGYHNKVTVYSIDEIPRFKINGFKSKFISHNSDSKQQRELQTFKDKAMTTDSTYSFVIWNGKSKGSYANIIRAIKNNKRVKVFLVRTL